VSASRDGASVTVSGPGVDREFRLAGLGLVEVGRVALSFAQGAACRLAVPATLYVRAGADGAPMYRVERDDLGVVSTFTTNGGRS
jgi:hypothetical protein